MPERHRQDEDARRPVLRGERNFVADMDACSLLVSKERCVIRAALTDAVRSPAGCASLGMLMTLADIGASEPALAACRPDWTATQDLSMHAAAWLTKGPVVVDSRLVRVGRKVVTVAVDVYDGRGVDGIEELQESIDAEVRSGDAGPTLTASGLVTFARLPGRAAPGMDDYDPARWIGQVRRRGTSTPPEGTMYERMGLRACGPAAGELELERTPYVANSIGTINGGAQAILVEAAAESMRPALVATDMQIHYLSQVRTGPARSSATVLRDRADHSVVSVELVDRGHDQQLLAVATVVLQPPP